MPMWSIVQKVDKELDEEKASFAQAAGPTKPRQLRSKRSRLSAFIPKHDGEEEFAIYASLSDKSMPAVMKYLQRKL
jgi:hypothetical protein